MNEINEINEDLKSDIYVVNITQPPEHQFQDINTSLNVELVATLKPDACWKHSRANSVVDAFQAGRTLDVFRNLFQWRHLSPNHNGGQVQNVRKPRDEWVMAVALATLSDKPKSLCVTWSSLLGGAHENLKPNLVAKDLFPFNMFFGHRDGSKPWYLVNPKIAGKWMFIPLKMVSIGIDPYPHAMILIVNHASFWNNVGACSQSWEEIWRHFTCPKSLQTCREPSQPCFETQLVKHFAVQNLHFTCESCKKCFRKSL